MHYITIDLAELELFKIWHISIYLCIRRRSATIWNKVHCRNAFSYAMHIWKINYLNMDYRYRGVGKFKRKIRRYSGHNIKMTRIRTGFLFYSCELYVRVSVLDGSDPSYTVVDRNFINLRNVPSSPLRLVSTAEVYLLLCICRRCYLEVIFSLVDVIALVHHFVAPLPSLLTCSTPFSPGVFNSRCRR